MKKSKWLVIVAIVIALGLLAGVMVFASDDNDDTGQDELINTPTVQDENNNASSETQDDEENTTKNKLRPAMPDPMTEKDKADVVASYRSHIDSISESLELYGDKSKPLVQAGFIILETIKAELNKEITDNDYIVKLIAFKRRLGDKTSSCDHEKIIADILSGKDMNQIIDEDIQNHIRIYTEECPWFDEDRINDLCDILSSEYGYGYLRLKSIQKDLKQ